MTVEKKIEQSNYYEVVYSDGVTIIDNFFASNLQEAKKIASENARVKNYGTAYFKVRRCYNGGVHGSSGKSYWH